METSKKTDLVDAAIVRVCGELGTVQESGRNSEFNFPYPKLADFTGHMREALKAAGLAIVGSIEEVTHGDSRDTRGGGKMYPVMVKISLTILHSSGQWRRVQSFGEAADTQDKALAKAITSARKSGLAAAFNLATGHESDDEGGRGGARGDTRGRADGGRPAAAPPRDAKAKASATPEPAADEESRQSFYQDFLGAMKIRGFSPAEADRALDVFLGSRQTKLEACTEKQLSALFAAAEAGKLDRMTAPPRPEPTDALERACEGLPPKQTPAPTDAETAAADAHRQLEVSARAFAQTLNADTGRGWILKQRPAWNAAIDSAMQTLGVANLADADGSQALALVELVKLSQLEREHAARQPGRPTR